MSNYFFQPKYLKQALEYKRDYEVANLLAGGTDLVISMRSRADQKHEIIDLSKITELKTIELDGDAICIGSMVTFTELIDSEMLFDKVPFLSKAAQSVGAPQIRNRGTIGGNICNASPAADGIPPLVCLGAQVNLQSVDENNEIHNRTLPIEAFILNKGKTAIKNYEILTHILFNVPSETATMGFDKIGRRNALAISRLNGACMIKMEQQIVQQIRFVLGAATSKPERFSGVEDYLIGKELTVLILKEAGRLASDYVLEKTGRRSSSNYKLPVITSFTEELIKKTLKAEVKVNE
ncbi:FAD binding domain-containing protein [Acetobacterium wieringae]|uniref:Nicotinate dehydrogenase FAD-subunit n=1 Tax=Acetobacterium wieringae TaxID=52694 RepID=A0A1F2PHX3_9FIRM|nr:FAD binding domain-containing protein [Acetobacterium wieringae]OFV70919.1 nicotinate dehydrogenase FAD-subunit [Acetobacterium wieringae]